MTSRETRIPKAESLISLIILIIVRTNTCLRATGRDRRSSSKLKTSRETRVPKAERLRRDRRSSSKFKTSGETRVPKAERQEARPSSRRLGKQEYLRRKG